MLYLYQVVLRTLKQCEVPAACGQNLLSHVISAILVSSSCTELELCEVPVYCGHSEAGYSQYRTVTEPTHESCQFFLEILLYVVVGRAKENDVCQKSHSALHLGKTLLPICEYRGTAAAVANIPPSWCGVVRDIA